MYSRVWCSHFQPFSKILMAPVECRELYLSGSLIEIVFVLGQIDKTHLLVELLMVLVWWHLSNNNKLRTFINSIYSLY